MPDVERIPIGVKGVDKLTKGGFVKGSANIVTGNSGTGKSIFLLQFCWEGLQNKENVLYITLEEMPNELKRDALQFGWDFSKYEKAGTFRIEYFDPFELADMQARLQDLVTVNNFTRVAIDSSSLIAMYEKDEYKGRKKMFKLVEALKKAGTTTLMSSEVQEDSKAISRFGYEEFVVDGVIVLQYVGAGEGVFRNLTIRKMRLTNHDHGTYPMEITGKGIVVNPSSNVI